MQYFGFRSTTAGTNNNSDSTIATTALAVADGTNTGASDDDVDFSSGFSPRKLTMSEQLFGRKDKDKDASNHGSNGAGAGLSHSPSRSRHRHQSITELGKTPPAHRFSMRSDTSNNSLGAGRMIDDPMAATADLGSPTGVCVYCQCSVVYICLFI